MPNLLVDSGFWMALFDPRDQHHHEALKWEALFHTYRVIIPYPTLYETLNTRFFRKRTLNERRAFAKYLKSADSKILPDDDYRVTAQDLALSEKPLNRFSLVDLIIRLIIQDPNIKADGLLTFNRDDFRDVCYKNRTEIISEN